MFDAYLAAPPAALHLMRDGPNCAPARARKPTPARRPHEPPGDETVRRRPTQRQAADPHFPTSEPGFEMVISTIVNGHFMLDPGAFLRFIVRILLIVE